MTLTPADLDAMVDAACAGSPATREQALAILSSGDDQLLQVVAAAGRVRRHYFSNQVMLNYLVNLKSGMCPEDCNYCSQALGSTAGILRYTWLTAEEVNTAVRAGVSNGASTVCLVASGRAPSKREVDKVADVIGNIQREFPEVKICACLGFLDEEKATTLREAGAHRYNHNLNTSQESYGDICSTHSYDDRVDTVETITKAGLSACSGLIAGMGETDEQLVDVAFALRDLGVDSVPVNFLLPFEGTPLASHLELTPQRCLRILAMVRFVHPDVEVRSAAGREYHLRSLQPLVLEIANSIFLGDYLTSEGQAGAADLEMIADWGFEVVGRGPEEAGTACAGDNKLVAQALADAVRDGAGIALRRRGAGTPLPANA